MNYKVKNVKIKITIQIKLKKIILLEPKKKIKKLRVIYRKEKKQHIDY